MPQVVASALPASISLPYTSAEDAIAGAAVFASGQYTVTAADVTATASTIATGLLNSISAQLVQVSRSGVIMPSIYAVASGTNIVVASNSTTYVLTAGDVVNWIAYGG